MTLENDTYRRAVRLVVKARVNEIHDVYDGEQNPGALVEELLLMRVSGAARPDGDEPRDRLRQLIWDDLQTLDV